MTLHRTAVMASLARGENYIMEHINYQKEDDCA